MFVFACRGCYHECNLHNYDNGDDDTGDDDDNENDGDDDGVINWKRPRFVDPDRIPNHGNDHNYDDLGDCIDDNDHRGSDTYAQNPHLSAAMLSMVRLMKG